MAIAEDGSTPAVTHRAQNTSGTATSNSFSPPSASLVVVCVTWMWNTSTSGGTITCADSSANSYTRPVSITWANYTSSAIFYRYYASAPGSITVTVTCSNASSAAVELAPRVITGAASSQAGAAIASDSSNGQTAISTTVTGSWVYGAGGYAINDTPTINGVSTQIDYFSDGASGDTGGVCRMTNPTISPGSVTIGWQALMDMIVLLEVLPSTATPVTVVGVTAHVTVAAPAGTLAITGPITVVGVTAAVTVAAPAGTVVTGPIILQQVTGTSTLDYGYSAVNLTTTTGSGLVVLAAWDLSVVPTAATMPAVNVVDSAGNLWQHAGTTTNSVTATRCAAFVCTNAMAVSWVSVSMTTFGASLAYQVIELTGMPQFYSLSVIDLQAIDPSTTISCTPGNAPVRSIAFAIAAAAGASISPATPAGWTSLGAVGAGSTGPSPITLNMYFQANVSAGASLNTTFNFGSHSLQLSALVMAIAVSVPAPVQSNPNFPVLRIEAGFGHLPGDPSQPPPIWTDISSRCIGKDGDAFITVSMGRQYELSTAEAGELTIGMNNADGAFTPGNTDSPFYPNVVLGTPVRVLAYWATPGQPSTGRWYHVGFGYVERWPQEWPDLPQWGISKLIATDAIAALNSVTMRSALDSELLLDGPYALIPGDEQYSVSQTGFTVSYLPADPQGLLATNRSRVNQRAALYADGTLDICNTGQNTNLLGDSETGFGTSNISSVPTGPASGPGVIYTDPSMPDPFSTYGVTVEFWVLIPTTVSDPALQPTVLQIFGPPSNYAYMDPPGLIVQVLNAVGSNSLLITLADGSTLTTTFNVSTNPQQIVLQMTQGSLSIYVNGTLATSTGLTAAQVTPWYAVAVGCCNYAYGTSGLVVGNYTAFNLAIYPSQLGVQRILAHYITGYAGAQNVDATTRIAQILAWANLGVPRGGQTTFHGISDGVLQGPAYSLNGSTAADAINQIVTNHLATLAAWPCGALVYIHKWAEFNQLPSVLFGDLLTEVAATDDSFGYDNTYVYNIDQITQQYGATTSLSVTANDYPSQQAYFARSALQETITTMSNLDVYTNANWLIAKYSQPAIRVASITIDAASQVAAFATLLPLLQGDIVQVARRPVGGAPILAISRVDKIGISIGPGVWKATYQVSAYEPENAVLTLGSSGYNVIGDNVMP